MAKLMKKSKMMDDFKRSLVIVRILEPTIEIDQGEKGSKNWRKTYQIDKKSWSTVYDLG